ncbi:hypothetical protein ACIBCA_12515 [Kitasatospora sp. NPDC051170]|uniref:hypothetical protein n=1 Tax=Kitasatospora sp. NPDC051170 TaxID=3364056 RepID=UPI0037902130
MADHRHHQQAWREKEREVDAALAEGERGQVFQDGDAFLQSLADEARLDLEQVKRLAESAPTIDDSP